MLICLFSPHSHKRWSRNEKSSACEERRTWTCIPSLLACRGILVTWTSSWVSSRRRDWEISSCNVLRDWGTDGGTCLHHRLGIHDDSSHPCCVLHLYLLHILLFLRTLLLFLLHSLYPCLHTLHHILLPCCFHDPCPCLMWVFQHSFPEWGCGLSSSRKNLHESSSYRAPGHSWRPWPQ